MASARDLMSKFPPGKKGDPLGPPKDREPTELEKLITECIESLPHATRMYPEIWAWALADTIEEEKTDASSRRSN